MEEDLLAFARRDLVTVPVLVGVSGIPFEAGASSELLRQPSHDLSILGQYTSVNEGADASAHDRFLVPATRGRRTELVVAPLSTAAMAELWGIIEALEGLAILAVGEMGAGERASLIEELERQNADLVAATTARPRDNDVVFELQTAFHVAFMDRCAGPQLRALYDSVRPHVQRYEWAYGTQSDAPYAPSIAEHREIIAAIASGDARAARDAIERHRANGTTRTATLIARFSPMD